jgi:hypothetical protein
MINEAANTTAQKAYRLAHFKAFLTEAGKAPLEQIILKEADACSESLFSEFAEYLFNCTHGLNKQHY